MSERERERDKEREREKEKKRKSDKQTIETINRTAEDTLGA